MKSFPSIFIPVLFCVALAISSYSCAPSTHRAFSSSPLGSEPGAGRAPASLQDRVEATLARHTMGEEIGFWRATLREGSLERDAADWILAWLPVSDLVGLDLRTLQEHVYLSADTYRRAPWRSQLPRELWLRFVVPHRVSQEPAQAWRQQFYNQIWPRVQHAPSMELAALEVNRWCREQATFKSTSGRDMGPLTTVKRGIGRCEEEMILTISALRSVGIPARSCATPYWTFTDNNHAWVEAWTDGHWYYLGGCEPGRCLNDAWFTGAARRTGFVRSVAYGEFDPVDEPLYRAENGSTIINSTRVYTTPFTLSAHIEGVETGEADVYIYINVLNFGSLRPIAKILTGATIEIGPGEYALTASLPGTEKSDPPPMLLRVVRGQPGEKVEITLSASDRYDFETSPGFWLRYPEGEQAPKRDLDLVEKRVEELHQLMIRSRKADRLKLHTLNEAEQEILDELEPAERDQIEATLEKPMEYASDIFTLLTFYTDPLARAALIDLFSRADDKDLLELSIFDIRSHIDLSLAVRHRIEAVGLEIPDTLFFEYVLAPRIDYEIGGPWREALPLVPLHKSDARFSVASILDIFKTRITQVERQFFGNLMNPAHTWLARAGSPRDRAIALVGLLRRNGFPARYRHGVTQAWLGDWVRLDPETGEFYKSPVDLREESNDSGPESDITSDQPGQLEVTITRGGIPYPQAKSYANFNISRPMAGYFESPWWDPGLGKQEWPSGNFVLCSAMRVPGGSIYGRLREFTIEPGKLTEVSLPVDIDVNLWDPGDNLINDPGGDYLLEMTNPKSVVSASGLALPESGLYFIFAPGEPASRMITALGNLIPRLERLGLEMTPILVGEVDDKTSWRKQLVAAGFEDRIWIDADSRRLLSQSDVTEFEPVVLLRLEKRRGGELILLRQGFDASIDGSVHLALDGITNP